ncbi:two-component regulator propeller domain-containing protein [Limibacter armeniacum]|uniref:hybrid sensor histidine kinase/response regulator transcription factor n=1 Tax=Limibacter armeniacum TaxID=466084 RepID=UPI002FE69B26
MKLGKLLIMGLLVLVSLHASASFPHNTFFKLSSAEGLVNNQTSCIFKDSRGFLWFGTSFGLSRYDGKNFKNYTHEAGDSSSLMDNNIAGIMEDKDGNLWLKLRWQFAIFDFNQDKFIQPHRKFLEMGINEPVEDIYFDENKTMWIKTSRSNHYQFYDQTAEQLVDPFENTSYNTNSPIVFTHHKDKYYYLYDNGVVEVFDGKTYKAIQSFNFLQKRVQEPVRQGGIFIDSANRIWVYIMAEGAFVYSPQTNSWTQYSSKLKERPLTSNLVSKIVEDGEGNIWIGTDHGGINLIDPKSGKQQVMYHQSEDDKSISQNSIMDLYKDDQGIIWVATYKNGISYYHPSFFKFRHFQHFISEPNSLPYNDVDCFAEDARGNLWIGTNGGGLIYFNRKNQTYKVYKHNPKDNSSLSHDVIVSLFIDSDGLVWIGTYTGGLNVFDGNKFTRYTFDPDKEGGLPNNNIWTISEDRKKRIWIGTLGNGIVLFDKQSKRFFKPENESGISLPDESITQITPMHNGDMAIGTSQGMIFYDMETASYKTFPDRKESGIIEISDNYVTDVIEDSRGYVWIATKEGLNVLGPDKHKVLQLGKSQGLAPDIISCILEDRQGDIWVSKSTGLSKVHVEQDSSAYGLAFEVNNFLPEDGLQGLEFNVNAKLRTSKGELIFGGFNGFNLFKPEDVAYDSIAPKVIFTDFQVFNKSMSVGEKLNGNILLQQCIEDTEEVELKHNMNVFSIEFATLDYFTDELQFAYMLEGFDQDWVLMGDDFPRVTYTNLNPGDYVFKVKASKGDNWQDKYSTLKITVLPPFYMTPLAYVIYGLLLIMGLILYRYYMLKRERQKFIAEQERLQTKRNQELDDLKLKFLTNISHELRTPLTLILTPIEKLMNENLGESQKKVLGVIEKNAHELLNLVNQLLDFRRLDLHGMQLNLSYGDAVSFLLDVCEMFEEGFKKKKIDFKYESEVKAESFMFDQEKVKKIAMNLLSNALKFTSPNGAVHVKISTKPELFDGTGGLELAVTDTGTGIEASDLDKIFNRFYQSDNVKSMGIGGSGIGLNLVKEMVLLHGGDIKVESEIGKGSTFIVQLPIRSDVEHAEAPIAEEVEVSEPNEVQEEEETIEKSTQPTVLLVEDNADFRHFMRETLEDQYAVIEAEDGLAGLNMAKKASPDLIISDVMMPEMDGLELCKRLKSDVETSHIPIILLTARSGDEDKLRGYETGADDYITKPFRMDILKLRIEQYMSRRKAAHQNFQQKMEVTPSEVEITPIDEKLIKKAMGLVEENIAEPKFSVEDLSKELGMSRVQLYKKLTAITGKSPIEFIRIIRLKRGMQLLEKSQLSISEIAYEVGFNSPRYFSKYFEKEYGMLPSAYIKKFPNRGVKIDIDKK